MDPIKMYAAQAIMMYAEAAEPSKIYCPMSEYVQTKEFSKIEPHIKAVMQKLYDAFYAAEYYHQDYLEKNPGGYCHIPWALMEEARKGKL